MTDLEKYQKVNSCETIIELQQTILEFADENGRIQGRIKSFDASGMAAGAYLYFNDKVEPNVLTREFGIRQQAMYLKYYKKQ